jgi:hypothetical protein
MKTNLYRHFDAGGVLLYVDTSLRRVIYRDSRARQRRCHP